MQTIIIHSPLVVKHTKTSQLTWTMSSSQQKVKNFIWPLITNADKVSNWATALMSIIMLWSLACVQSAPRFESETFPVPFFALQGLNGSRSYWKCITKKTTYVVVIVVDVVVIVIALTTVSSAYSPVHHLCMLIQVKSEIYKCFQDFCFRISHQEETRTDRRGDSKKTNMHRFSILPTRTTHV